MTFSRKLLLGVLCLPAMSWASYQPITGSTVTVVQPTGTSLQTTANPSGTYTVTPGSGTWQTNNAATINTVSTNTTILQAVQLASGTATNPFNITGSVNAYQTSPSTVTVLQAIQLSSGAFSQSNTGIFIDSSPYTQASSSMIAVGGFYSQVLLPFISSTTAAFRMNQYRALYIVPSDANGVILGTATTNPNIVGFGGTAQPVTQSGLFTIANSTIGVVPGGPPFVVTLTTITFNGTAQPVGQSGTFTITPGSGTFQTSNAATLNVVSTNVVIPATLNMVSTNVVILQAVQLASGTTTNPFYAHEPSTLNMVSTFTTIVSTYADNGALANANRFPVLPAIYGSDYLDGVAATDDDNAASYVGTRDGGTRVTQILNLTDHSFSVSTGPFTVPNSTIDVSGLCGNGISTTAVVGIRISATQTTAGIVPIIIIRRSTPYTGIFSTMVASGYDPTIYSVPTSSAIFFNTTDGHQLNGSYLTTLDSYNLGIMATGTATPNDIYISPAAWRTDPVILRGTQQCIGVNTQGTVVSGGKFNISWFWKEITSP
jgi:hypothetical protein